MKRTNKANGIRSAVPRLTDYMRSDMGVIILALILAALSAVMTILGPNQIGRIATLMSDGLTGNIDLAAIAKVGIFLAVRVIVFPPCSRDSRTACPRSSARPRSLSAVSL